MFTYYIANLCMYLYNTTKQLVIHGVCMLIVILTVNGYNNWLLWNCTVHRVLVNYIATLACTKIHNICGCTLTTSIGIT